MDNQKVLKELCVGFLALKKSIRRIQGEYLGNLMRYAHSMRQRLKRR